MGASLRFFKGTDEAFVSAFYFFFPGQNDIGDVFQCGLLRLSLKTHTELCFERLLALT